MKDFLISIIKFYNGNKIIQIISVFIMIFVLSYIIYDLVISNPTERTTDELLLYSKLEWSHEIIRMLPSLCINSDSCWLTARGDFLRAINVCSISGHSLFGKKRCKEVLIISFSRYPVVRSAKSLKEVEIIVKS